MRNRVKGQGSRVKVENLNRRFGLNKKFVAKIAAAVLRLIKKEGKADLEIIFTDNAAIKKLNKRYKGEDAPTDVLSFKMDRAEFGEKKFLGEIFISLDTARTNASFFGTRLEDEIVLYVIHGILHLFGYDDRTGKQKAGMSKIENRLLRRLCRQDILSKVLMRR